MQSEPTPATPAGEAEGEDVTAGGPDGAAGEMAANGLGDGEAADRGGLGEPAEQASSGTKSGRRSGRGSSGAAPTLELRKKVRNTRCEL